MSSLLPYAKTLDEIQAQLTGENIVLLYFTASWCGPCQKIKPFVEELKKTYPRLVVLLIDVDDAQEAAMQFAIKSMPTFLLSKGATPLVRFSGADPEKLGMVVQVAMKASASPVTIVQPRKKE